MKTLLVTGIALFLSVSTAFACMMMDVNCKDGANNVKVSLDFFKMTVTAGNSGVMDCEHKQTHYMCSNQSHKLYISTAGMSGAATKGELKLNDNPLDCGPSVRRLTENNTRPAYQNLQDSGA